MFKIVNVDSIIKMLNNLRNLCILYDQGLISELDTWGIYQYITDYLRILEDSPILEDEE